MNQSRSLVVILVTAAFGVVKRSKSCKSTFYPSGLTTAIAVTTIMIMLDHVFVEIVSEDDFFVVFTW